jgi:hypothetical protein
LIVAESSEMKHYCEIDIPFKFMKNFTDEYKAWAKELKLWELYEKLNSDDWDKSQPLLDVLIQGFKPSTAELKLPDGPTINLRSQIRDLIPIPCGQYKFKFDRITRRQYYRKILYSYVKEDYGFDPSRYETPPDINCGWSSKILRKNE